MIRVLLVDDHLSFREAMAIVFGLQPDITVVAQAGSLAEARDVLADVDLAVVDLGLPDGSGLDLIGELRAVNPQGAVLVLTASSDRAQFARAVEAGAAGVLHKSTPLHELVGAVRLSWLVGTSARAVHGAARRAAACLRACLESEVS